MRLAVLMLPKSLILPIPFLATFKSPVAKKSFTLSGVIFEVESTTLSAIIEALLASVIPLGFTR